MQFSHQFSHEFSADDIRHKQTHPTQTWPASM